MEPLDYNFPNVSFVMPAYKATFISAAIESILNQTISDFELVIIDDDSPEDLRSIVSSYSDRRIRYLKNERNIGGTDLVMQWNECIKYAKGKHIVLAADDDTYHPAFLEKSLELINRYPEIDIVRVGVNKVDEHDRLLGIDGYTPELLSKHAFLYYWLHATVETCIGNFLFRAESLLRNKFTNYPFGYCADAATAIKMAENGIANCSRPLFNFRISGIHLSGSRKYLRQRLMANTLFYRWLLELKYEYPQNETDQYYYRKNSISYIYRKAIYDYYNQIVKYLPWTQLYLIKDCVLASRKDKIKMLFRSALDRISKT